MTDIRFRFQLPKVINALAYFASHGIRDLTKLKAAKLLYYVDKYHLLKYGRPVIGDHYVCMDFGPVPSDTSTSSTMPWAGKSSTAPSSSPSANCSSGR